jgi:hypothetical protein
MQEAHSSLGKGNGMGIGGGVVMDGLFIQLDVLWWMYHQTRRAQINFGDDK